MGERPPSSPPPNVEINPNRAVRRHSPETREWEVFKTRWDRLASQLREVGSEWEKVNDEQGHILTKVIYQGEPFIWRFLQVRNELPAFLAKAYDLNSKKPFSPDNLSGLNTFDLADLFSQAVKGVTLQQIERMPLPLVGEDIKKINRMFRGSLFSKLTNEQLLVRASVIFLASQSHARPDLAITIPKELSPLYQRLTAYFDYYTFLMTDFSLPEREEQRLMLTLAWANKLPEAIGCYLPGRLGITPSSAIKLYQQRAENSYYYASYSPWKLFVRMMERQSQWALPKNVLPADLAVYQHYDREMDQKATMAILDYYESQKLNDTDLANASSVSGQLLGRLRLYRKRLRSDIGRSSGRCLKVAMAENHLVSSVTVTWQYKQTLMFILHFNSGREHLTLDLSEDDHLYGLPPGLVEDNPQVADLLLADILSPLLAEAQRLHPEIERKIEPITIPTFLEREPLPVEKTTGLLVKEKVEEKKRGPRRLPRRVLTPIAQILAKEPELPEQPKQIERQFNVIYSRKKITDKMGRKARPGDIDRVMAAIHRFEFRQISTSHLDWSGGARESLRVGKLRVILKPAGGNVYLVEKIGYRKDIYDGYGDAAQFQAR